MKVLRLFFAFWGDVLNTNLVTCFADWNSFNFSWNRETSAFFETKKFLGGSQTRWRFFLWKISWRSLTWHCEATISEFFFFRSRKMDGVDPKVVGFEVHWSFRNQKDFYFFLSSQDVSFWGPVINFCFGENWWYEVCLRGIFLVMKFLLFFFFHTGRYTALADIRHGLNPLNLIKLLLTSHDLTPKGS